MTQDDSLSDLSAVEMRRRIGTKELSPIDLLTACHRRIDAVNPALNAVVAEDREAALAAAREAEQAVVRGDDLGPLHGLPIGIKDLNEELDSVPDVIAEMLATAFEFWANFFKDILDLNDDTI